MSGNSYGSLSDRSCWAIGLWAGVTLLDLTVWSRSLAGAMTAPLPALLAVGSTILLMTSALAALILWRAERRRSGTRQELRDTCKDTEVSATSATKNVVVLWPEFATMTLPLAWVLIVGWGTTPFTLGGLFACWGLLITAVGLVDVWGVEEEECEFASDRRVDWEKSPEEASTQWQKRLVVDGREMIEGEVSVDFAAGQKEAVVHLSFCPALASIPEIHAEDSLGSELDICAEASHPYGARLAVRRSQGIDTAETRQISYSAMLAEPADSAA